MKFTKKLLVVYDFLAMLVACFLFLMLVFMGFSILPIYATHKDDFSWAMVWVLNWHVGVSVVFIVIAQIVAICWAAAYVSVKDDKGCYISGVNDE